MTTSTAKTEAHERPTGWGYYPATFAALVYSVPLLAPDLPWWAAPAIGLAAAVFGALGASARFSAEVYGRDFQAGVALCVALSGLAAGVWLVVAWWAGGPLGTLHGTPLWQWLLLGLVVFGGWWTMLMLRAPSYAEAMDRLRGMPEPRLAIAAGPTGLAGEYARILFDAGVTGARITSVETSESGAVETVNLVSERAAPGRKALTYAGFAQKVEDIALEASRAFEERRGITDLQPTDVLPEPAASAHRYKLHVTVKKQVGRQIPYQVRTEPRPWEDPLWLGKYQDDRDIWFRLCHREEGASHLTLLGMTGAGKGNVINVLVAELTASREGEVWMAANQKLVQLVYKWLLPWLRRITDRPVIDRVAGQSQREVLEMLADALHYATLCNEQLGVDPVRVYGAGRGALAVILDESSDVLESRETIVLWDGRRMNASQIWAALKQLARTSPVNCIDASQYALFTAAGDQGAKQRRNTGAGICGKIRRRQDMGSVMPGIPGHVDPTKLPKHEFFFQPDSSEDEPRAMRGRPAAMFREEHIVPVAINNTQWRTGLDPDLTKQLRHYADRWAAKRLPELVKEAERGGYSWPGSPVSAGQVEPGADAAPAVEAPVASSAPEPAPTQEATHMPAPDNLPELPDLPDGALPQGWTEDGFDVWAYFTAEGGTSQTGSGILQGLPTTDGIKNAVARFNAAHGVGVPDPLGAVLRALSHPNAPQDWISTETLAGVLGRYKPTDDELTKRRAWEAFGLELGRQIGMKSEELPRPVDPKRRKGWQVPKLREAGKRLAAERREGGEATSS
jgi:hypothetical protein